MNPDALRRALGLVLVTPGDRDAPRTEALVELACEGGVRAVLLRERQLVPSARADLYARLTRLARSHGVHVLVSRDADLAADCGADGVQLGFGSAAPAEVRARHPSLVVGRSAHWPLVADDDAADYVMLSPFRPTPRSLPRALLTDDQVHAALARCGARPVVALGGLTARDVPDLPRGLAGIAVLRAVADASDPRGAAAVLRSLVDARQAFDP